MRSFDDKYYIGETLRGNSQAFSAIVNRYKAMGMTIAMRILRDRETAEEALQDSFLKAYNSLGGFNLSAKFSTWFYKIVYNQSVSYYRKQKPLFISIDSSDESDMVMNTASLDDSLNNIPDDEQKALIDKALASLDEVSATVVTLFYLNENSTEEISEITELTRQNIKTLLFRARKKMYAALSKSEKINSAGSFMVSTTKGVR